MDQLITLQQDSADKIKISLPEQTIIKSAMLYFGWRKCDLKRVKSLGSSEYNRLIKHLSKIK